MKHINKFDTTEDFTEAIGVGGGQLSDLEHFVAYTKDTDKIHVKPKPNYFIFYQELLYGTSTIITKKENGYNDKEISLGRSETVKIDGANAIYGFSIGPVSFDVVGFDGSNYDTSKINSMSLMFANAINLKNTNFSNFNTKNVTTMYHMFEGCSSLVEIDLSSFDTRNVTAIDGMFKGCSSLVEINLSNFDISKFTSDTNDVFDNCTSLSKIICKQAFKDWCIKYSRYIGLPDTMVNGTVGAVGSGSNWEIVDYQS